MRSLSCASAPLRLVQRSRLGLRSRTTRSRAPPLRAVAESDGVSLSSPVTGSTKLLFASAPALGHAWPGHPESNERVPAILEALEAGGLTPEALGSDMVELRGAPAATQEQLLRVHSAPFLRNFALLARMKAPCTYDSAPTYVTKTSVDDAALGVGAALALVDAVVLESKRREASGGGPAPAAFALCRPPGHHALPGSAMGFCLYSTAALAARHAQAVHGLRRVLIFDFDVHHGNGTDDTFAGDAEVLYISTHQAGSYPGTGRLLEIGTGAGEGATLNIPLPGGSGDAAARTALEQLVGPAAERFKPDIILVSAGYDAHWRDPLAGLQFTDSTYHALSAGLRAMAERLCGGRIVFLLEGGTFLLLLRLLNPLTPSDLCTQAMT